MIKDWIYDLYVKEHMFVKQTIHTAKKNINHADHKDLPKTQKNGKSKSDR